MDKVDIVVTFLDDNDKEWEEGFNRRKEKEVSEGIQKKSNRQAFGEERIRDWETLRYWLRGVEYNCEWIRNVIIVVYDKRQIPSWINLKNKRLRVVEHREYMSSDMLPTYNAIQIKFYTSNIEGISEKYILSDDDCFFIHKIDKEMFFQGNKTVQIDTELPFRPFGKEYLEASDGVFYAMLNNNLRLEEKYMQENKTKYWISHLPEARDREFEKKIILENEDIFKNPYIQSRFRHKEQYTADVFLDLLRIKGECVLSDVFKKRGKYVTLKSTVDFESLKDYDIICFNDTEQLDDFKETKEKLLGFLQEMLPKKSSFEK